MENGLKYNAKMMSMFGQNGAVFGSALEFYHDQYQIKVLTSDMAYGAGLSRYKQKYPNDFYDVGIAEQNLMGITAGLVSEGFKCVATAQACFLSMRSFEPVRQYMGYMQIPAILIGINSGFALSYFGNSHYALEDLCLMRTIPNMTLLSPADAGEAVKAFEAALQMNSPVYIRLSGTTNNPVIYGEDYEYDYKKANVVYNQGNDVVLLATGSMVYQSLKAAEVLKSEGIGVEVIDIHCLKPIDKETILKETTGAKLVVSVEEHFVHGGLGSAVAEVMTTTSTTRQLLKLGVQDQFSEVGDYQYLLDQNGLTPEKIATSVKEILS
jgi:transketolase